MAKQKFYVVWEGRRAGVYNNWDDCKTQIDGFTDAKYKSFPTLQIAENAFKNSSENYIGQSNVKALSTEEKLAIGFPNYPCICVDAAWNTATGFVEYQGVILPAGTNIFKKGPYSQGTNNVGEFLAIVHAISYCKKQNLNLPIFSDSETAIGWVMRKQANTKLQATPYNQEIINLTLRATNWLNTNAYSNKILKWETKLWGENPADFGRK